MTRILFLAVLLVLPALVGSEQVRTLMATEPDLTDREGHAAGHFSSRRGVY